MRRIAIAVILSAVALLIPALVAHEAYNPCVDGALTDPAPWYAVIEHHLSPPKALRSASKTEFLAALSAAIIANPKDAPELATAAATARPEWALQILEVSFAVAKTCELRAKILCGVRAADPRHASILFDRAVHLAPDCSKIFEENLAVPGAGREGPGAPGTNTGNFGNPPGANGAGSQGNLIAVCHNGHTIFLTPEDAQRDLRQNPGDTIGACQVTPSENR